MRALIVIPARYGSTRFPGKPLAPIAGTSLLERVWQIAGAIGEGIDVVIATDDDRVKAHAEAFGATVVMTSSSCRNGTERTFEALTRLATPYELVVNLQGDAVLMPPWIIAALVEEMSRDRTVSMCTACVQLTRDQFDHMSALKQAGITTGTTVTFDAARNAMYFSKTIIPYLRAWPDDGTVPVFQHIGVYAFTPEAIERYVALPMGTFEAVEQLEQLRALEHGLPIRVVPVSLRGRTMWSIDNPQDVATAEEIIAREGELL